jgi:two-component system NtrC family sensor kinase
VREAALRLRIAELEAQLAGERGKHISLNDMRLEPLLSVSASLLVAHDLPAILRLTARETARIFPGACCALVFLADDDGRQVELRATNMGHTVNLVMAVGQADAGRAFLAPRPMLLLGPELEMTLGELNEEQEQTLQNLIGSWPPTSALLAPLRIEGQRLGALVLYGGNNAHLFHPRDLPFIQALANLVAVAVAETKQRERAMTLQHALSTTKTLHAETQARLTTAEAQLLQSAKLAAVGELAASIAHEINNPLYAARNSLYLVEQDLPPDAPQRDFLEIAQSELGRIAKIISRMRDFYRPSRDELEPVEINMLLEETVELVQTHLRRGQIIMQLELAPNLPKLTGHADQIRQVFLNLMINACDAMQDGGTLTIRTQHIPQQADQPSHVRIDIADTGYGITPEHLARIFEPFYTTKSHGTGLGLAISAHIITQHGGQIQVESTIGSGTSFNIVLPTEAPAS